MKILKCKDIIGHKCAYIARGQENTNIVDVMFRHGEVNHPAIYRDINERQKSRIISYMQYLINQYEKSKNMKAEEPARGSETRPGKGGEI